MRAWLLLSGCGPPVMRAWLLLSGCGPQAAVVSYSSHAVDENKDLFWSVFGSHLERASALAGEWEGLLDTDDAPSLCSQSLLLCPPSLGLPRSRPAGTRPRPLCSPHSCCRPSGQGVWHLGVWLATITTFGDCCGSAWNFLQHLQSLDPVSWFHSF